MDRIAVVMRLHEFVPTGRRPSCRREWRWLERFTEMEQDLPERWTDAANVETVIDGILDDVRVAALGRFAS